MKDPEKGAYLTCLRSSSKASVAEIEWARERAVGNEAGRWDHVGPL